MRLRPRWRKVIRDLWDNKARTILVVLAIAVGVFAFGSVFITRKVLLADMNAQYSAVNVSSINIGMSPFEENTVRWALRQEGVADAQGRAVHLIKIVDGEKTHNLNLYVFGDYEDIRLNRITPEKGAFPPGRREILFERSSLALVGAEIGDVIEVELPDGQKRELYLVGTVHDLDAIPSSLWPEVTGYVSFQTLEWLGFPGTYNRLEIVAGDEFGEIAELERVADDLRERLERSGYSVGYIGVQKPGEHWAADTTRGFITVLSGLGVFSLILSGFLVVNTIVAVLAQQRREIGMMKAVGATGKQVTGLYMVTVAFLGLLSLIVAVPVGLGLAYLSVVAVARFLNIDILNFHLPLYVFLLEVGAALLVPALAALVPILSGVRVTVREAVSDYGISNKSKGGPIERLLVRMRSLPRPVLLSLRNTFRRKGRLFMTLSTLVLAGTLFISVLNVRGALMAELDKILLMWNYDVQLILDDFYQSQAVEQQAALVPGVTRAEGWSGVQAQRIKPDGTRGATFDVLGLPPDSDFVQPAMLEGRWLQEGDRNAIALSSEVLRDDPDIQAGDKIVLETYGREREWEVVGVVLMTGEWVGYANFDHVSRIQDAPGMVSVLLVGTERRDGEFQAEVASALEDRFKRSGIGVSQTITRETIVGANASQFDFLVAFLLSMAVMVAVVGGLGLAGTMSLNVLERTREIGVMRSIGASNRMVRAIVIVEGVLVGVLSWVLAVPLSVPIGLILCVVLGMAIFERPMSLTFSPLGVVIWLAIVASISVVASLLPAQRAAAMSVRETLAYG